MVELSFFPLIILWTHGQIQRNGPSHALCTLLKHAQWKSRSIYPATSSVLPYESSKATLLLLSQTAQR